MPEIRESKRPEAVVTVVNRKGLHARASAKFVKLAEAYNATVTVTRDGQTVGGTSIMGLMMLAKLIIVVDEDVDVQNLSEVMWRVFNNIDAGRDVMTVEGPLDALDHSSPLPHLGTKMGIDATRKWSSEGHLREWPEDITMSEAIKKLVDGKWGKYGI